MATGGVARPVDRGHGALATRNTAVRVLLGWVPSEGRAVEPEAVSHLKWGPRYLLHCGRCGRMRYVSPDDLRYWQICCWDDDDRASDQPPNHMSLSMEFWRRHDVAPEAAAKWESA